MEKQLISRIQKSIDYIEENIYEKISIDEVAKKAFMSKSSFYNVFSSIFGSTVKDYIRKRRLSLSACDLINSELTVLDIALKYQYSTSESYSRAFKELFGVAPKKYREKNLYTDVFPRVALNCINLIGGNLMIDKEMNKDIIDRNLNSQANGYVLDIDIDRFQDINDNYGYDIGDKVLIEVPERVKSVLKTFNLELDVTRINNDEFAVIIANETEEYVKSISQAIISVMEKKFIYSDKTVSVTVSIGISSFTVKCNNEDVINSAKSAMKEAKRNGRNQYKIY